MVEKEELSIEETNKIRLQLGLPLIPVPSKAPGSPENVSQTENRTAGSPSSQVYAPSGDQLHDQNTASSNRSSILTDAFIDKRAFNLRKRINMRRGHTLLDTDESGGADWLNDVSKAKQSAPKSVIKHVYDQESEYLSGRSYMVAHDFESFVTGKDVILTLKNTDIEDDQEQADVLENVDMVHDAEDSRNLKLKKMAKDRKRGKPSFDNEVIKGQFSDDDEDQGKKAVFTITEDNRILQTSKLYATSTPEVLKDKRKIELDTSVHEESMADYEPVKIKKRKKVDRNQNLRKRERSNPLPKVNLVDEDAFQEDAEDQLNTILSIRQPQVGITTEDIARDILTEREEKKSRAKNIENLHKHYMVIDEADTFLNSLRDSILEEPPTVPIETVEPGTSAPPNSDTAGINELPNTKEPPAEMNTTAPTFYTGIASTLQFLKEKQVLTSEGVRQNSIHTKKRDLLKLEQRIAARKVEEKIDLELAEGSVKYTKNELDKISKYKEDQVMRTVSKLQKERLKGYNPDVKLQYKDDDGHELTTKEAYKRISQAWHGTKSNKKKLAKMRKKIEERRAEKEHPPLLDL
ncbi:U4/U6-U5 snRNP complex subunit SNU66 Ecym_1488 [Eremothecium cymbalariae DBVPG|uniref:Uncharacterized protein n=1 Tax=Eremothecium cymbalariae (strain CBS 270.75 / DBVPG 7215 / KCTC 17166 / NRRL Y-17582) TaxID=931890 RepID=G8JMJ5_ERECY|nr:hypothetical protein Ecym_1488 [Eremothecium cymbalariae DBVPG\